MRSLSTWPRFAWMTLLLPLALAKVACSDGETIKAPVSDQNLNFVPTHILAGAPGA